jgi:hypothetical protein
MGSILVAKHLPVVQHSIADLRRQQLEALHAAPAPQSHQHTGEATDRDPFRDHRRSQSSPAPFPLAPVSMSRPASAAHGETVVRRQLESVSGSPRRPSAPASRDTLSALGLATPAVTPPNLGHHAVATGGTRATVSHLQNLTRERLQGLRSPSPRTAPAAASTPAMQQPASAAISSAFYPTRSLVSDSGAVSVASSALAGRKLQTSDAVRCAARDLLAKCDRSEQRLRRLANIVGSLAKCASMSHRTRLFRRCTGGHTPGVHNTTLPPLFSLSLSSTRDSWYTVLHCSSVRTAIAALAGKQ